MKKLFILLLAVIMLVGCSSEKATIQETTPKPEPNPLAEGQWYCKDTASELSFNADFTVASSTVTSAVKYNYMADVGRVILYDESDTIVKTWRVLFVDAYYLVLSGKGETLVYENQNAVLYTPHEAAKEYIDTTAKTIPCCAALSWRDDVLTLSSYDYDGDAADSFDTWQIPTAKDAVMRSVNVTVENGNATVEVIDLNFSAKHLIGESYTHAYFELDSNGAISSLIFYGDLIIQ